MPTGMQELHRNPDAAEFETRASDAMTEASDAATANAIAARLGAVGIVPANRLRVRYRNGTVTLSGTLDWQFQRQAVLDHVRRHPSAHHVVDEIEVRPLLDAALLMQRIDSAARELSPFAPPTITVDIDGPRVTLRGQVATEALRKLAETTAWATPGVGLVENRIVVG